VLCLKRNVDEQGVGARQGVHRVLRERPLPKMEGVKADVLHLLGEVSADSDGPLNGASPSGVRREDACFALPELSLRTEPHIARRTSRYKRCDTGWRGRNPAVQWQLASDALRTWRSTALTGESRPQARGLGIRITTSRASRSLRRAPLLRLRGAVRASQLVDREHGDQPVIQPVLDLPCSESEAYA